ncbi:hypothetical protein KC353_g31 [Hortaea werneckii]|nr:hypothetical protein KC353_g31 [Hortaea werneckii]
MRSKFLRRDFIVDAGTRSNRRCLAELSISPVAHPSQGDTMQSAEVTQPSSKSLTTVLLTSCLLIPRSHVKPTNTRERDLAFVKRPIGAVRRRLLAAASSWARGSHGKPNTLEPFACHAYVAETPTNTGEAFAMSILGPRSRRPEDGAVDRTLRRANSSTAHARTGILGQNCQKVLCHDCLVYPLTPSVQEKIR